MNSRPSRLLVQRIADDPTTDDELEAPRVTGPAPTAAAAVPFARAT